jgi:serine protease Do
MARVLAPDTSNDLACLRGDAKPSCVATLRAGVKIGVEIAIFGFPLVGVLSTKGNFTVGSISAIIGMRDNTRFLETRRRSSPAIAEGPRSIKAAT